MNIKKSKIALVLSASLFLVTPFASALAAGTHCDANDIQMGGMMQEIKSELRDYVKGVKSDDAQKMQLHLDKLLKLSAMNGSNMDHTDMQNETMPVMDHSKMDHSEMKMEHADMQNETMTTMDHSKMGNTDNDMSTMPSMKGMSTEQHQHMMYMQGMTKFQNLFKSLDKAKDKTEITTILGSIKDQIKNTNQGFRQNCD